MTATLTNYFERSSSHDRDFPFTVIKEYIQIVRALWRLNVGCFLSSILSKSDHCFPRLLTLLFHTNTRHGITTTTWQVQSCSLRLKAVAAPVPPKLMRQNVSIRLRRQYNLAFFPAHRIPPTTKPSEGTSLSVTDKLVGVVSLHTCNCAETAKGRGRGDLSEYAWLSNLIYSWFGIADFGFGSSTMTTWTIKSLQSALNDEKM